MAPECITDRKYSEKTDVWSFGVTLFEIVARDNPYPGLDLLQVATRVSKGELAPSLPSTAHPFFHKLLGLCCAFDPKERLTFADILAFIDQQKESKEFLKK